MVRRFRKFRTLLVSVLFAVTPVVLVAEASLASAQTEAQAVATATAAQKHDCVWNNPIFFSCRNPMLIAPACSGTGINKQNEPQHICGGLYSRTPRKVTGVYPPEASKRYCETTYNINPYGAVLGIRTVKCYSLPPMLG